MSVCVLDTDVIIAALERTDAQHIVAARVLRDLAAMMSDLQISAINYAEALVRPAQHRETLRAAVAAIDALGVDVHSPNRAIARSAARLRGQGISLADGFALATATALGASVASFDHRVQRTAAATGVELASGIIVT